MLKNMEIRKYGKKCGEYEKWNLNMYLDPRSILKVLQGNKKTTGTFREVWQLWEFFFYFSERKSGKTLRHLLES